MVRFPPVRRVLLIAVVVIGAAWTLPGAALATPVTKTFTYGPVKVEGYAVRQTLTANIARPEGRGSITHMEADVIDPRPANRSRSTGSCSTTSCS